MLFVFLLIFQEQQQQQQTISALSNELELFLRSFKDRTGDYKYFDKINNMIATSSASYHC